MTSATIRWLVVALALVVSPACSADDLTFVGTAEEKETFTQAADPKIDALWVVDDSLSMGAEQEKVAGEAAHFLLRLETEGLDYHIGVIVTDPNGGGRLRLYGNASISGCEDGCRYVTPALGCPEASAMFAEASGAPVTSTDPAWERCPALWVFQDMLRAGTSGSALESAFGQTALALGLDVRTGERTATPAENDGFLRDDADLLLLFVSDEDEGLKEQDVPVHYIERLFGRLKGDDQRVSVSSIIGWPLAQQIEPFDVDFDVPLAEDVCAVLGPSLRGEASAAPAADVEAALEAGYGCLDVLDPSDDASLAELGVRYIELTCRMSGEIVNICDADYQEGLVRLASSTVRLSRSFPLARASQIDFGRDCEPFTDDDGRLDCDDDGSTDGPIDGPICVTATTDGGTSLVARGADGWMWDPALGAVTFPGDLVPVTDSDVEVRVLVKPLTACQ